MLSKTKNFVLIFFIVLTFTPALVSASVVYEQSVWITGTQGFNFDLPDLVPGSYKSTLTNMSVENEPFFGFDFLGLIVSTGSETLGYIFEPGSFFFEVTPSSSTNFFANVFGDGSGLFDTGLAGIEISKVPIPAKPVSNRPLPSPKILAKKFVPELGVTSKKKLPGSKMYPNVSEPVDTISPRKSNPKIDSFFMLMLVRVDL